MKSQIFRLFPGTVAKRMKNTLEFNEIKSMHVCWVKNVWKIVVHKYGCIGNTFE
jgi:hypothetical protein